MSVGQKGWYTKSLPVLGRLFNKKNSNEFCSVFQISLVNLTHPRLSLGDSILVPVHEGADGQPRRPLLIPLLEELLLEAVHPLTVDRPCSGKGSQVRAFDCQLQGWGIVSVPRV